MSIKLKFTNAWLSIVSCENSKRDEYSDTDCPGLILRVTKTGVKTFSFPFRLRNKTGRLTIGKYPSVSLKDAREAVNHAKIELAAGVDPREKKRKTVNSDDLTVTKMAELFIERYARHIATRGIPKEAKSDRDRIAINQNIPIYQS